MNLLLLDLATELDWSGIYGGIYHYAMIMAFFGSALISFFYFWAKGRLDMDEEPKFQMLRDDEEYFDGR